MTLDPRFIWKAGDIVLLGKREKRHRPGGKDHDQSLHAPKTRPQGQPEAEVQKQATGSGEKESPVVTDDVEEAARLLGEGKYVQLKSTEQVATLVDRLKQLAEDAAARGEEAPNYDLCKVTVPGTNLFCVESKGIPRIKMPQLKAKNVLAGSAADEFERDKDGEVDLYSSFLAHLEDIGVGASEDMIDTRYLKASQSELNGVKVSRMMAAIKAGKFDPRAGNPMIVSRDNYVVDGHHRWAAVVGMEYAGTDLDIPVLKVDMDIIDLLDEANRYAADMGVPQQGFRSLTGCGRGGCAVPAFRVEDAVIRHKPGGHDHDQSTHGNWSEGAATDKPDLPTIKPGLVPPEHLELILDRAEEIAAMRDENGELLCPDFPETVEEMVEITEKTMARATPAQIREGIDWYDKAHRDLAAMATKHGFTIEQACAIAAICSPGRQWDSNLAAAEAVMRVIGEDRAFTVTQEMFDDLYDKGELKGPGEYKPSQLTAEQVAFLHPDLQASVIGGGGRGTTKQLTPSIEIARAKGDAEIEAAILERVVGVKVRNFYNNLHDPEDPRWITVDTWQVRVMIPEEGKLRWIKDDGTIEEFLTQVQPRSTKTAERSGEAVQITFFTRAPGLPTELAKKIGVGRPSSKVTKSGKPSTAYEVPQVGMYPMFAEAIRVVADRHGYVPNEVQAILWTVVRDEWLKSGVQ